MQPTHRPARVGDVREGMADITDARRLLGYEPRFGFEEGLRLLIDHDRLIWTK
jgi:nucleoside-diphosphate-sugar epimerase